MTDFTLDRVYMLATSSYKCTNQNCQICKNKLSDISVSAMIKKVNYKDINKIQSQKGKCGHVFHTDCINEWVSKCTQTNKRIITPCPVCQVSWNPEIANMNKDIFDNNNKRNNPIK